MPVQNYTFFLDVEFQGLEIGRYVGSQASSLEGHSSHNNFGVSWVILYPLHFYHLDASNVHIVWFIILSLFSVEEFRTDNLILALTFYCLVIYKTEVLYFL